MTAFFFSEATFTVNLNVEAEVGKFEVNGVDLKV